MKSSFFDPPLVPRDGNTLKVLGIARISGGPGQTELSNDDQGALHRVWLDQNCSVPYELTLIAGTGSGECVDREEAHRAQRELESGKYDLVISEDLGRIFRRVHAYMFCETAEDVGTRVIAINDHVDTGKSDWRLNAFFASMRHELYNADTAKRIRRTQRNRFQSGGMIKVPLFCYIKPPGCKSDADLLKNLDMEPVVHGIFDRLEEGWTFARVADWLNEQKVPVGPGCRRKSWNGVMVRRLVYNPILKGLRLWNEKRSVRINRTGKRRSVKASPDDRLERHVPHLAFIDSDRYDMLIAKLTKNGELYSVPKRRSIDPRKGRAKKRTRFPGQHAYCRLCESMYVFGGHGQTDHLMCDGARAYHCWNGVTFDGKLAAKRVADAVFEFVSSLPEFDSAILAQLRQEAYEHQAAREHRVGQVEKELTQLGREEERLVAAVKQVAGVDALVAALKQLQDDKRRLQYERKQLQEHLPPPVALPSTSQIRDDVRAAFEHLAVESFEFGDGLRKIVSKIVVYPVQICDGGEPVLRGKLTIDLSPYLSDELRLPALESQLRCERVLDFFKVPQRAEYRERVVERRAQGQTEAQIAAELGLTVTAVQRAAALHRKMLELGLTDPYIELTEPPSSGRLRRHRHKRFRRPDDNQEDAA